MMIGQEELYNKLMSYTVQTLPQTMLIVGLKGCGKHTLVSHLVKNLNISLIDITKNLSLDYITELYTSSVTSIYLIDTDELDEKKQNVILKLIEEPTQYMRIILLSSNKNCLINTVINRCIVFEFRPYTKEDLCKIANNIQLTAEMLDYCETPGQLLSININTLIDIKNLCETMILKLKTSNFANVLTIADKINYSDEYSKYDYNIFFKCFEKTLFTHLLNKDTEQNSYIMYSIFNKYMKLFNNSKINKHTLMINMLATMWNELNNIDKL